MMALQVPPESRLVSEEEMETVETNSPLNDQEDIDIDLDIADGGLLIEGDDKMQEEVDDLPVQPSDTLMEDEDHPGIQDTFLDDEEIQDAAPQAPIPDEDVTIDDLLDDVKGGNDVQVTDFPSNLNSSPQREKFEDEKENVVETMESAELDVKHNHSGQQDQEVTVQGPTVLPDTIHGDKEAESGATDPAMLEGPLSDPHNAEDQAQTYPTEDQNQTFSHIINKDEESVDRLAVDQEPDSEANSRELHPVYIYYQDEEEEIDLFKPTDQDEESTRSFLLADRGMFNATLQHLLASCRTVLQESLEDMDELELSIEGLGLQICESNDLSQSLTCAQLLRTFLHLHENEGVDPPPLRAHLYTKINAARRWNYLCEQAKNGEGYSTVRSREDTDAKEVTEDDEDQDDDSTGANERVSSNVSISEQTEVQQSGISDQPSDGSSLDNASGELDTSTLANASKLADPQYKHESPSTGKASESVNRADDGSQQFQHKSEVRKDQSKDAFTVEHDSHIERNDSERDNLDASEADEIDELGQGSSSGSSTLKGDATASAIEKPLAEATEQDLLLPGSNDQARSTAPDTIDNTFHTGNSAKDFIDDTEGKGNAFNTVPDVDDHELEEEENNLGTDEDLNTDAHHRVQGDVGEDDEAYRDQDTLAFDGSHEFSGTASAPDEMANPAQTGNTKGEEVLSLDQYEVPGVEADLALDFEQYEDDFPTNLDNPANNSLNTEYGDLEGVSFDDEETLQSLNPLSESNTDDPNATQLGKEMEGDYKEAYPTAEGNNIDDWDPQDLRESDQQIDHPATKSPITLKRSHSQEEDDATLDEPEQDHKRARAS